MTDNFEHRKPTKAEKEARRAERAAQQEIERQKRVAALPASVHGAPMVKMEYTAVGTKKIKEMRRSFTPLRKAFLKHLAQTQSPVLKALGMSDNMIAGMLKGNAPNGFNVHHKKPLGGGGKNEFSNFILIQNNPYHTDFHKASDVQICKMQPGETKTVKIPMPEGSIFIPPAMKQRVAEAVKQASAAAMMKKARDGR